MAEMWVFKNTLRITSTLFSTGGFTSNGQTFSRMKTTADGQLLFYDAKGHYMEVYANNAWVTGIGDYKTVTFSEAQVDRFRAWLESNATLQVVDSGGAKETWVINSDAAGVFATTQIAFTSNGQKFTSIGANSDSSFFVILYYDSNEIAGYDPGLSGGYEFDNDAYRTITFDTPPTGALLTWLQSNATRQVVEYLTTETDLIKVANAIRAKSGTTAKLSFPDGFVQAIGGEEYDGDYKVTPKFTEEVLKTKNKVMKDNVLVYPIEVARVSNPSGGTTVYIGGITNG